jgi:hypothetical protein
MKWHLLVFCLTLLLLASPSATSAKHLRPSSSGDDNCLSGEPPLPDGLQLVQEVSGEFDGDGQPDRLQLFHVPDERWGPSPFAQTRLVARVLFGRGVATPISDPLFGSSLAEHVIGVTDLDGDGRDEVLIRTDGATWSLAGILKIQDCKVVAVVGQDGKPYEFGYYGHSMCCPRGGNAFVCRQRGAGERGKDLIEAEYEPEIEGVDRADWEAVAAALQNPDLKFRWHRRTLRLKGARVIVVSKESGESREGDMTVPMVNHFDCGGVDPP